LISRQYLLKCQICDNRFDDDGFVLECATSHEPSLLVTHYATKQFKCDEHAEGIYRYRSWLPIVRTLGNSSRTITYQSERMSRIAGLPNLWIAFNGYWPEKGASLETATFKELEVYSVLSRIPERHSKVLVVASAGNTGAAFARICSQNKFSCLVIVPEIGLHRMRFIEPFEPCVKIVSLDDPADYNDAIALAHHVSQLNGFFSAGGVKNVAARDGLGTTMLNAVETIGRLPQYYFQAIGSGTGGIAVHECAKRLIADGRFGQDLPRLILSQNLPFIPIFRSWKLRQRELIKFSNNEGKKEIQQITAHVLSNQQPPYSIRGGVFDILNESRGDMLTVENLEVHYAMDLFEESEGIDIDPAAGVALASLFKAAASGQIDREALVLLHITGGGWYRHQTDHNLIPAKPALKIDEHKVLTEKTVEKVIGLFQ
jgi:cysteate synthase